MAVRPEPLSRKTVTVLFCDVAGSTRLGEDVDPEALRGVMLRYFDEMRGILERHGGTVEKFIGDAIVGVFGVPLLHEDDALRAVRAADDMRTELDRLNGDLEERWGVRLESRIGINTGEVVVGDPAARQTIATGDTFNVAFRLQEAAQPGEILLGKETYRLVEAEIAAGPLRTFPVKGKREAVQTWSVDAVQTSAASFFRRADAPLVGRRAELDFLHAAYRRTLEEQTCVLVSVLGPAGIGKSRLAQEFAANVFGASVARGRCLPYGDGITYFPIAAIVRELAGIAAGDTAEQALLKLDSIVPVSPDMELVRERVAGILGLAPASRTQETFWALRRLVEGLARERPLVLVLEDIHWGEPALLDLVDYLVGWSRGAPVLLIVLARPELLDLRPAWGADALVLEPLATDDVHGMLENLLGAAELDPRVVRRITQAAEGNPLFVEELVRALVDEGVLAQEEGEWTVVGDVARLAMPASISALLSTRVDHLPPDEREVLQCAAVVGKQFWWSAVLELAPESVREHVGTHLHALVRKRLIVPAESTSFAGEDSFQFGHILIRDAAYAALPKLRRAELHEAFAAWLERKADEGGGDFAEILGHHLAEAFQAQLEVGVGDDELAERAAAYLTAAGRKALQRDDVSAAGALLTRAVALAPTPDLRVLYATVLMRTGSFAAAAGELELAMAAPDERVRLRAEIERAFLQLLVDPEGATERMRAVAEAAIPRLEELADDLGLARAWWLVSQTHVVACRWSDGAAALERAIDYAGRAGDENQEGTLIGLLAQALVYGPMPADAAIARCVDLLAHALGDRALEAALKSSLAHLYAMRGDFDEARDLWAQARGIYDDLNLRYRRASRSLVPAMIELLAGNPAAAEQELRWGYDELTAMGEQAMRTVIAAFLAEALTAQQRLDEAEAFCRESAGTASTDDIVAQVVWRAVQAKVDARRGRLSDAERLAGEARGLVEQTDFSDLRAGAAVAFAEVLLAAAREEEAERLAREAHALHLSKGNVAAAQAVESLFAIRAG